jgi:hypothetical protein
MSVTADNSLLDNLRRINQQFDNLFLLANPFFRLTKPTSENLIKYKAYKQDRMKFRTLNNFMRFPLTAFLQSIWNISLSLVTPWEWFPKQVLEKQNHEFLGISQITNPHPIFEVDPLLGQIPMLLNQNKDLAMFYLNGTRISRSALRKLLVSQSFSNVIVNSKTLSPIETVIVLLVNFKASMSLLRIAIKDTELSSEQMYLISEGLIHQFKRPTYANLVLLKRLANILEKENIKKIFFTLEGHAHEAMVMTLLNTSFPDVQIKAIQHAPIVSSQSGYFENLLLLKESDSILCTGEIPKEFTSIYLEKHRIACRDVQIVGSTKNQHMNLINQATRSRGQNSILFLPEGTENSTLEFLDLLHSISPKFPELKFVIRLHPATRTSARVRAILKKSLSTNAVVSDLPLISDLQSAKYCVYRGTASAIEGLAYAVIPIHYNTNPLFILDPILSQKLKHPAAAAHEQLEEIIRKISVSDLDLSFNTTSMAEYFIKYFAPLNIAAFE